VVALATLPEAPLQKQPAHRLVNSKFPPIHIFDDVASNADFEAIYRLQGHTNPRLLDAVGQIRLVPPERRPFGITGCSYALAPFVHVNPLGSRFSRGEFGVLYAAENPETAIAESRHHQQRYFQSLPGGGLKYDRITMRGLKLVFSATLLDIRAPALDQYHWRDPENYIPAQQLGDATKTADKDGLLYESVRAPGHSCYALFSPHLVSAVVQTRHYEYIWDGTRISDVVELTHPK
jgi:hypothetical protein